MSTPFFSIIMPCYNDGAYLPKALSAIAAQSFRDFEICFVNDASTDNSEEVIFAFIKEHPDIPVRYRKAEKNRGASLSKNEGMYMARGEYILFNDADDWMDSDHLQVAWEQLRDCTADIFIEGCRWVTEEGVSIGGYAFSEKPSRWVRGAFHGCFFRRSVITENGITFKANSYYDDFYLLCEINSYTDRFRWLDEAHFTQMLRSSSFTRVDMKKENFLPRKLENTFREMVEIEGRLSSDADRNEYKYMCTVQYFSVVFGGVFPAFSQRREHYLRCREIMEKYHPGYRKNPLVTLFKENGYKSSFKKKIWLSCRLETVDAAFRSSFLMSCLLWVYQTAIRIRLYRQR